RRGAAEGRLHGGGGGVAKEVEKALARGLLPEPGADRTMIEEDAGIEVIGEVDLEPRPALGDDEGPGAPLHPLALVLTVALLAAALLEEQPVPCLGVEKLQGLAHLDNAPPGGLLVRR